MTVFKKPNGKWVAQVYDQGLGRMRQVGTFGDKREAMQAEADAMARRTASGREPVQRFASRWTRDYPRPRASTDRHNAERVQAFAKAFGKRRMDSITVDEARLWAIGHPTQLAALRAMFNDARRSGLIVSNPFSALGLKRSRGRRDLPSEWLTATDIDGLCEKALEVHGESFGPQMSAMIRFAAHTGVRPGEMYALRFTDLSADTLVVARSADSRTRTVGLTKNGRARTIVYSAQARQAVEDCPRLSEQELVFVGPRGGQLWSSSFSWLWSPVRSAAGRPKMAWYELRHFAATQLLELGLAPADVAVQLGHTDGGALVMSTYGHPSDRAARGRILAAMDGHETGELAAFRDRRAG